MKKLLFAVLVAATAAVSFAEEAAPAATAEKAPETQVAARPKPDRAQYEARRKEFEARRQEMRAKRLVQVSEVLRKAGVEEAKVAALAEEIDKVYTMRRPRPTRPPRPMPAQKPAAEQK